MAAGGDRIGPTGIPRDPTITPIMRVFSNPDIGKAISSFLGPKDRMTVLAATTLPPRLEGTKDQAMALSVRIAVLKPFIDTRKKALRERGFHIAVTDDRIAERTIRFMKDALIMCPEALRGNREIKRIRGEVIGQERINRGYAYSIHEYEVILSHYNVLALDPDMLHILNLEPQDALECFLYDLYSGTLEQKGCFYRVALSVSQVHFHEHIRMYITPTEQERVWLRIPHPRRKFHMRGIGPYHEATGPRDLQMKLGIQLLRQVRRTSRFGFDAFLKLLGEENEFVESAVYRHIYQWTIAQKILSITSVFPDSPSRISRDDAWRMYVNHVRRVSKPGSTTGEASPGGGEG